MKAFKRFIAVVLVLVIAVCFVNAQTDIFLNFASYFPAVNDKYPQVSKTVSDISERLSRLTGYIPSPSEIIAYIKNEEPPIDPSDVAVNAYIENSPMLSFYPKENIGIIAENNTVNIFGIASSADKAHLIVEFTDQNGESIEQSSITVGSDNEFSKVIDIPETDGTVLDLSVYGGNKPYGEFESWVYNYVELTKNGDSWEIAKSPVFDHNKEMYEKDKSVREALKHTASIQSNSDSIISIAEQLTEGISDDYSKVLALHDWICSYMYYDVDSLSAQEAPPYYATDIVKTRKAVCLGFATLMAALCRSINIPCNVVSGYALGVGDDTEWTEQTVTTDEQNHAWNEVYVDGRWVIIDTTWDCANKIANGEMIKGDVSHLYFDANLQFFSANHKIIEYQRKR